MLSVASFEREIAEKRLRKEIEETFEEAYKDIEKKIAEFNNNFIAKEQIHLKDVQEGRWTQEQFDSWLAGQVFQGNMWEDKRDAIIRTMMESNSIATAMINEQKSNLFAFNANYQAYSLEHDAGVNFGFSLFDSSTVARLIRSNPQTLPMWKIDEPKDYNWNLKIVNNSIRQGIIQGEKLSQIAKRLADGLESRNKNKMLTFARTAMTEAQNAGRRQRLIEAESKGIKVLKQWMCTLDERTRWQHRELDGQKQPNNKPFTVGRYTIQYPGDPAAHPSMIYNCRCTMIGVLVDYPSELDRYDNIEGKPIGNMTYKEWERAKKGITEPPKREFTQVGIGLCRTVAEVNALLNDNDLFKPGSVANLDGCDLDSAKSIAASYEQVFAKYPQLKGRFAAPDAHPQGMSDKTYAWCYIRSNGKVQVNPGPEKFGNWSKVQRQYEHDVEVGWHPKGTTAESIVTHEIGHAIDGLLAREGIKGGITASGQYRYASSTLRNTIMKRAAKKDEQLGLFFELWGTDKEAMYSAVLDNVSEYATKNPQEWFAECFAEYITSANPRIVASELGKELEKLLKKLEP